jgi:hypothetical protein
LTCCIGGTSVATPIWSAFETVIAQRWGGRIGSIFNTRLYEMGPQGLTFGIRDVVTGSNDFNGVAGFAAGAGFDQSTGWGTADISRFVINFAAEKTLLVGGANSESVVPALKSAEFYNFSTASFSATGSMMSGRIDFPATLLDNGMTLVSGGNSQTSVGTNCGHIYSSAELYNPSTGAFSATGNMTHVRKSQSSVLLGDGTVLIAGGDGGECDTPYLSTAELYDPGTGAFTMTGSMNVARSPFVAAVLLENGKVLIAGWATVSGKTAELYNPTTKTFSYTGSLVAGDGEPDLLARLVDGRVLVAGGFTSAAAQIYDPTGGIFTQTGSLSIARAGATMTLLNNGNVLVAGGLHFITGGGVTYLKTAEIFNPATGSWSPTGSMIGARAGASAAILPNGKVLIAGGETSAVLSSAEIYDPTAGTFSSTGNLTSKRVAAAYGQQNSQ